MDKEEARQKEAERTLKRIKATLNQLEDGSAWQDPVSENEEIQRMKKLLESGYSHDRPGLLKRLSLLVSRPAFLALLITVILVFIELLQR